MKIDFIHKRHYIIVSIEVPYNINEDDNDEDEENIEIKKVDDSRYCTSFHISKYVYKFINFTFHSFDYIISHCRNFM